MTRKPTRAPAVKQAKGAVREAIGKLIGDDAEVRAGEEQQQIAADQTADHKTPS